jgi:hypothetical protein
MNLIFRAMRYVSARSPFDELRTATEKGKACCWTFVQCYTPHTYLLTLVDLILTALTLVDWIEKSFTTYLIRATSNAS